MDDNFKSIAKLVVREMTSEGFNDRLREVLDVWEQFDNGQRLGIALALVGIVTRYLPEQFHSSMAEYAAQYLVTLTAKTLER